MGGKGRHSRHEVTKPEREFPHAAYVKICLWIIVILGLLSNFIPDMG